MFKVIIAFFFEFVNSLASQSIVFHTFVTTKISAVAFLPSDVYKKWQAADFLVYHAAYFRSKNARGLSYPVILPMLPRKLQYSSYRN